MWAPPVAASRTEVQLAEVQLIQVSLDVAPGACAGMPVRLRHMTEQ